MIKPRTGTTGTKYLLVVTLLAWVASALVGYGLLAVAENPELNSLLALFAVGFGIPLFYLSPPALLWNVLTTSYKRSGAFKESVQTFKGAMVETKAWVLFIIVGLMFHQSILDGLGDAAGAYFDFVGSIVFSNPLPEEPTSNSPVNLADIISPQ
jgi:hypothetical protein